jgi:hypothetical protein
MGGLKGATIGATSLQIIFIKKMVLDRKVDVDEIIGDDDAFLEVDEVIPLQVLEGAAQQRVEQAKGLLSRGKR